MRRLAGSAVLAVCALALASATGRADDKKVNIEGTYVIVGAEVAGMDITEFLKKGTEDDFTIKITADKMVGTKNGKEDPIGYKIDTSKKPYQIDMTGKKGPKKDKDEKLVGIFKIDGDKLIICMLESDKPEDRPTEFKTSKDSKAMIMTLQKKK